MIDRRLLAALLLCVPMLNGSMITYIEAAVGGDQIFSQPCDNLTGWTDVSNGAGAEITIVSNECFGDLDTSGHDPAIIQGPLNGTDEFASMKVVTIWPGNSNKAGFILATGFYWR